MVICFSKIESFPAKITLSQGKEEISCKIDLLDEVKNAEVALQIQESEDEYFCQGELKAIAVLECARCMKSFEEEINNRFDFVVSSEAARTKYNKEATDTEDYVMLDKSGTSADINELLVNIVQLSVSLKPICKEDCKGLCNSCGVDLNENSCNCVVRPKDSRWVALSKLSQQQNR